MLPAEQADSSNEKISRLVSNKKATLNVVLSHALDKDTVFNDLTFRSKQDGKLHAL